MTELTSRVTSQTGNRAHPADVLHVASEVALEALRDGQAVELLGLVRVQLADRAGSLKADPLQCLLTSGASGPANETVVVIAVETADRFSQALARRLTQPGRRALVAEGLMGVMETIKTNGADVVIMDSNVEMESEIRQWLKGTPDRSLISLITVYSQEDDPSRVRGFRVSEDESLVEPYEMQTLETVIAGEITRIAMERKYFAHEVSFQFPSLPAFQQEAASFMERLILHAGLDEPGQVSFVAAFREAVDNACRHGNQRNPEALVSVAYVLDQEKITVTVEDEGPGFDTSAYLAPQPDAGAASTARNRHAEGGRGGLGIMLILKSVDRMEYNSEGNIIKLTRYLSGKDTAS